MLKTKCKYSMLKPEFKKIQKNTYSSLNHFVRVQREDMLESKIIQGHCV